MHARYLKRLRMELDLRHAEFARPELPDGYFWQPWHPRQLVRHSEVKSASFLGEVDSRLFLSLSTSPGCEDLMRCIAQHPGFLPAATWLIEFAAGDFHEPVACGTVQGLVHSSRLGSIQNVGIVPEHRGFGLGRALVLKALIGFQQHGLQRVYLDVTAANHPAVELYRSLGFHHVSSTYLEMPEPVGVG